MSLIIEIRLSCIFYNTIDLIACRSSWGIIMVMVMVGQWGPGCPEPLFGEVCQAVNISFVH